MDWFLSGYHAGARRVKEFPFAVNSLHVMEEGSQMRGPLIVLLERDDFARELYTDSLVAQGFRVRAETQLDEALAALRKGAQLFIAGIGPGQAAVAELVAQIRRVSPATPLMVILSRDAAEGPLRALRDGALEALTAPVTPDTLILGACRCLETVSLFDKLPELHRHVELFLAAQRLMRAPDVSTLAREVLDAAALRLPSVGVVISTADGGGELIAARGLDDDDLRELVSAWDPAALSRAEPLEPAAASDSVPRLRAPRKERFEDRVVVFPPGAGPFARVVGQTARLQPGLVALRIGPPGKEGIWAMLFPPPRTRRDARPPDAQLATHLGMLATEATFALDAAERFPGGAEGAIDPLTDLFDERYFTRTLEHEIQRHLRQGGPEVSVLVVDVEGLPEIVDAHGGLIGERLLVGAARVLVRVVRELDLVARTGPHQFSVLLMGSNLAGAERSAERVRRAFAAHRFLAREGLDLRVAVAVGVAAYPQHGDSAPSLRDVAEQAAKAAGQGA
jgi:two-component system cell cycle response regulator